MRNARDGGTRTPSGSFFAHRLRLVEQAAEIGDGNEALRIGVQQAVSGLGGLGGFVLLRSPGNTGGGRSRPAAVTGLPATVEQAWSRAGPAAAERLIVEAGDRGWLPAADILPVALPPGARVAAVPLPGGDGTHGVLAVVTGRPRMLDAEQWQLLDSIAGLLGPRLDRAGPRRPENHDSNDSHDSHEDRENREGTVGAWEWDAATDEMFMDPAALRVFGLTAATFDGKFSTWARLLHPDDAPRVAAGIEEAARVPGGYVVEYRAHHADGRLLWVEARAQSLPAVEGRPAVLRGLLWDTTSNRVAVDTAYHALRHMTDGFLTTDQDRRITFANTRAEQLLRAGGALTGRLLGELPSPWAEALEGHCRQAADSASPLSADLVAADGPTAYRVRIAPVFNGLTLHLADVTEQRRREAAEAEVARAATDRAVHIRELTTALAEAITVSDVLRAAADRILPLFGATGLIFQELTGGELRARGSVGYPPLFIEQLSLTKISDPGPAAEAIRSRTPRYLCEPRELAAGYREGAKYQRWGGKQAWAFLPLTVAEGIVGCCVVSFSEPHDFPEEERALLSAIGGLVAQAFERARLYDAEHTRASALQRGLLPRVPASLPAATTVTRYFPSAAGSVGGDWYDVIPLSADRVAFVIGDVMGHGLREAVTMGRLRTAVHTLAALETPPEELLAHLNDLVNGLGDDAYVTCLYAVYDPVSGMCTFANAGHPPAAVVGPGGSVEFIGSGTAPNPPLGAAVPPFATHEQRIEADSLLVFYTDGLVESASRDIDTGLARLSDVLAADGAPAAEAGAGQLDRLCDAVSAALLPPDTDILDDAALMIARTHVSAEEDVATWGLPDSPVAAGEARQHIRRQLAEWQLDELVFTTELLVSELVGNVTRHARGPVRLRLIRSRTLVCEVTDGSASMPQVRHAGETDEGGRGLQLVAAVSRRWGSRSTPQGKCIWTEQPL